MQSRGKRGGSSRLDSEWPGFNASSRLRVLSQPPEDQLHLLLDFGEFGFGLVIVDGCGERNAWMVNEDQSGKRERAGYRRDARFVWILPW